MLQDLDGALTVLTQGKRPELSSALSSSLDIHELPLAIPAGIPLAAYGKTINRTFDEAKTNWILILREGEEIGEPLAEEIRGIVTGFPRAWGFRTATEIIYRGKPLRLGRNRGEIRLFNRRHARFDARRSTGEMPVQGPVVVLKNRLTRRSYPNAEEHLRALRTAAVPQSWLRRSLLFLRRAAITGAWWRSTNTLRYLWIESGFDQSSAAFPEAGETD